VSISYLYRNAQCKLPESCERDWHAGLSHSSNRREMQRYLVLELFAQIHCNHLWMLCKQSGNCIETYILKQIPYPGLNFCLFFNSYCRTMRYVVPCVGTILFLDC
jgi:hypothetical protein